MKLVATYPLRSPSLCAAPRAHLFTLLSLSSCVPPCSRLARTITIRQLSGSSARWRKDEDERPSTTPPSPSQSQFSFRGMAAPPRLPKEEQEIFEVLQRQSTGAFSTPRTEQAPRPRINQSPDSSLSERDDAQATVDERVDRISATAVLRDGVDGEQTEFPQERYDHVIDAKGEGEELHPNVLRGAQPEFEGERNPKTGEIGGPKNEPLRWGPSGEWTYNGRTTDF